METGLVGLPIMYHQGKEGNCLLEPLKVKITGEGWQDVLVGKVVL